MATPADLGSSNTLDKPTEEREPRIVEAAGKTDPETEWHSGEKRATQE